MLEIRPGKTHNRITTQCPQHKHGPSPAHTFPDFSRQVVHANRLARNRCWLIRSLTSHWSSNGFFLHKARLNSRQWMKQVFFRSGFIVFSSLPSVCSAGCPSYGTHTGPQYTRPLRYSLPSRQGDSDGAADGRELHREGELFEAGSFLVTSFFKIIHWWLSTALRDLSVPDIVATIRNEWLRGWIHWYLNTGIISSEMSRGHRTDIFIVGEIVAGYWDFSFITCRLF